jgi:hypothetical protein
VRCSTRHRPPPPVPGFPAPRCPSLHPSRRRRPPPAVPLAGPGGCSSSKSCFRKESCPHDDGLAVPPILFCPTWRAVRPARVRRSVSCFTCFGSARPPHRLARPPVTFLRLLPPLYQPRATAKTRPIRLPISSQTALKIQVPHRGFSSTPILSRLTRDRNPQFVRERLHYGVTHT